MKDFLMLLLVGLFGLSIGAGSMAYFDSEELAEMISEAEKTLLRARTVEKKVNEKLKALEDGEKTFCGAVKL